MTPAENERVAELATGFALGELSESELRELHQALTDPAAGAAAARAAWQALGTVGDLRAGCSPRFQDEVRSRIGRGSGSFLARMRRRLGLGGRVLEPVPPPPMPTGRSALAAWLLLLLAVAAILAWLLWPEPRARVDSVTGRVLLGGSPLVPGSELDLRPSLLQPAQVPEGGHLVLTWPDGSGVTSEGPASLVPQVRAISLASGTVEVDAGPGGFVLGLPGIRVELAPGAGLVAELGEGSATLGLRRGSATRESLPLRLGWACDAERPGAPFPWRRIAPAPADPPVAGCPRWVVAGRLHLAQPDSELGLELGLENGARLWIDLAPGRVSALQGPERTVLNLPGPPLAERKVVLDHAGGRLRLRLSDALVYDELAEVASLRLIPAKGAMLQESWFRSGPPGAP